MIQKPIVFLAFANERESEARYLRGIPKEQALIRQALEPAVDAGLCEIVVESNATIHSILNTFQKARYKDRIAIFHYAGHADGYQLLLETLDGSNEIAHGGGLVSFLAGQQGLKLIFLNGCSTQQQSEELVEAGVPSVIGTSQAISDEIAQKLAVRFYSSIGNGSTIQRAWKEAVDEVNMGTGGGNTRSLYFGGIEEVPDRLPWEMYVREGSEIIKEWNLPEAVDNPLFGLPDLPEAHLPDEPYRFLQRYTRDHAEIFFGRSYAIRELYDRATDPTSSPVILLYGQSGVGKSSMLDAGVLPRLEQVCQVVYVRREASIGLTETLRTALASIQSGEENAAESGEREESTFDGQIAQLESVASSMDAKARTEVNKLIIRLKQQKKEALKQEARRAKKGSVDTIEHELLRTWRRLEEGKKPLVILLDQVEEVFTQAHPHMPTELEDFLAEVQQIFGNPGIMPTGKLILSYRKEYNPEIEEACKHAQIPREKLFLKHLEQKDIIEVIEGLGKTERLRRKYQLKVEPALGAIIADDLLEDRDSPIAPVLQILLTKMWKMGEEEGERSFTVARYQQLKLEGLLMGDFLDQQLEEMHGRLPQVTESGMALDILYQHTTVLGTAASREIERLMALYPHEESALEQLIQESQDLYLLTGAGYGKTALAHDTLAPLVQQRFRESDYPGQRASRILMNKVVEFESDPDNTLDEADLAIVEAGVHGMPSLNNRQDALIQASQERRSKAKRRRRNLKYMAIAAVLLIAVAGIEAFRQSIIANRNLEIANVQTEKAIKEGKRAEKEKIRAEAAAKIAEQKRLEAEEAECIAEEERIEADRQRGIALLNAEKARRQRDSAELARQQAKDSAYAALLARKDAEIQRDSATSAKQKAERQRLLAIAKTLATKSIQAEDPVIKTQLAALAHRFNQDNGGADFDPDIYLGMYDALKAEHGESFNLHQVHSDGKVAVRAVTFDPSGQYLYTTGSDGKLLRLAWEGEEFSSPTLVMESQSLINRALRVGQGEILLARTRFSTGSNPFSSHPEQIHAVEESYDLAFIPNRQAYLSIGLDNVLRLYDVESVTPLDTVSTPVSRLAVSPDGQYVVGAANTGKLLQWSLETESHTPQTIYSSPSGKPLTAVAYSKDGKYLAFGDESGRVFLQNLRSNLPPTELLKHEDEVTGLAFHPDSWQLASCSWDGSIHLFNLNEPKELPITLSDHNAMCWSLTYSPNGSSIVVGLGNGKIKRWPTAPTYMVDGLCESIRSRMSSDEWYGYINDESVNVPDPICQ